MNRALATLGVTLTTLVMTACSSAEPTAQQRPGVGPPIAAELVGASCSNVGCGSKLCTAPASGRCAQDLCLVDARRGADGVEPYCTADCRAAACPSGFECLEMGVASSVAHACVAQTAVCGDGVVQRGEACDDGNLDDWDTCSADCKRRLGPPELVLKNMTAALAGFLDQPLVSTTSFPALGVELLEDADVSSCGAAKLLAQSNRSISFAVRLCADAGVSMVATVTLPFTQGEFTSDDCSFDSTSTRAVTAFQSSDASASFPPEKGSECVSGNVAVLDVRKVLPNSGGLEGRMKIAALARGERFLQRMYVTFRADFEIRR